MCALWLPTYIVAYHALAFCSTLSFLISPTMVYIYHIYMTSLRMNYWSLSVFRDSLCIKKQHYICTYLFTVQSFDFNILNIFLYFFFNQNNIDAVHTFLKSDLYIAGCSNPQSSVLWAGTITTRTRPSLLKILNKNRLWKMKMSENRLLVSKK
jgi:hypothetical protein